MGGYSPRMKELLRIDPAVAAALDATRPVVALETSVLAHGLPAPHNRHAVERMIAAVRAEGAVPALIGLADGVIRIGLDAPLVARFAAGSGVAKVSERDLAPVLAGGGLGATTVAATLACARLAGIRVFATGGIGGVHRGASASFDISADLLALARTPVAVVCSGAKSILDLPRTLEVLETQGVPVLGYGTDSFPAFYARDSGLPLSARIDTPAEAAAVMARHRALGLPGGVVIANPPPAEAAIAPQALEDWTEQALAAARAEAVTGKAVTPFLLARLAALSGGATVAANLALLEANARLAGAIAVADRAG